MACTLYVQIDEANASKNDLGEVVPTDPKNALRATALEIQNDINPALVYMGRPPIVVHPDGPNIENYLGDVNTIPSSGMMPTGELDSEGNPILVYNQEYAYLVDVHISNYDFINSRLFALLPSPPKTFWIVSNNPPQSGEIA